MSMSDPLTVTISGTPITLPRVSTGDDESEYMSSDGLTKVTFSHQYGKRTRRVARIDLSKITSDPFRPAENVEVSSSFYVVFDVPKAGYTAAEMLAIFTGFNTLLTASSNAVATKVLGGES